MYQNKILFLFPKVSTPKWQYRWIESYVDFQGPVSVNLQYKLSNDMPNTYDLEFTNGIWYLPKNTIPYFTISFYAGTARRIQYTLNNTDPVGNTPKPCFKDWPPGSLTGTASFILDFCQTEIEEGEYEGIISAYNPINGWMSSKSFKLAVSEPIGPISISDGTLITDMNTQRNFTIKLESAGKKTCIVFDANDDSDIVLFGYVPSCHLR